MIPLLQHIFAMILKMGLGRSKSLIVQENRPILSKKNNLVNGIIFTKGIEDIYDMVSEINQDIMFIDTLTWNVYEHYTINEENVFNLLGFFNNTSFQYQPLIKLSFYERRGNLQGYEMKVMSEEIGPFIYFDLTNAPFDDKSQTYDVTYSTQGNIHYSIHYNIFFFFNGTISSQPSILNLEEVVN